MPKSKLVKIGVWENGRYIGVVIFGVGATRKLVHGYGLSAEEGCELVRIALCEHANSVTRIVSIALRMLRKQSPRLRLVVSFADPEYGHHGGIYQGGNWIYCGMTGCSDEYMYRGRRWQGRAFRSSFPRMEHAPGVVIVKGSSKHRYLYPLDIEMRRRIESLRETYPKRAGSIVSDATAIHAEEGGATPTPALQKVNDG